MQDAMIAVIHDHLSKLLDPEDECFEYDLEKVDATALFTSMFQAQAMLYNGLTNSDMNFLEFSHLCNQLVVQDMLERKGA